MLSLCSLIFEEITITIIIIVTFIITFQVCVEEEEAAVMKGGQLAQD